MTELQASEAFVRRAREKMKETKITQVDLAKEAGVSVPYVNYVFAGKRQLTLRLLLTFCQMTDMTPDECLGMR